MAGVRDREEVHPADVAEWRAWLAANHTTSPGCWLVSYKPSTGRQAVDYESAIQEALCFGWVDSQVRSIDAERGALLYTPRKAGSAWASTNKRRVELLEADGRMTDAGRAVIEAAKADGSWTILDDVEAGILPADLSGALDAVPAARAAWEGFPRGVRRGMHQWVISAKRPDTRAKRIAEIVSEAAAGRRAGQWAT